MNEELNELPVSPEQQQFCEVIYQFVKKQAGDQKLDGLYTLMTVFEIEGDKLKLLEVGCAKPKEAEPPKLIVDTP